MATIGNSDKNLNTVPQNANRVVIYQPVKRSVSTSPVVSPDLSKLSGVDDRSDEERQKAKDDADLANQLSDGGKSKCNQERPSLSAGESEDVDSYMDADGKFNIFKIFKIVPIGINIMMKLPVLASAFTDLLIGTTQALVNTSISSIDLLLSLFSFSVEGFKFAFIILMCFVENISHLNICIVFYLIDLIVIICILALLSFLALMDAAFLKKLLGISTVQLVMSAYKPLSDFDDLIYSISGVHIIHYPDYINKMCYTCSMKLNTKTTATKGKWLLDGISTRIPNSLSEPIDKFISAGSKISSVFNI